MGKLDIVSLEMDDIEAYIASIHEKKFRAGQIYDWLHNKMAISFNEMSSLPLSLRQRLEEDAEIYGCEISEKLTSSIDNTTKYLFHVKNHNIMAGNKEQGNFIESVYMEYHHGGSVCVSSQVGCAMGCKFCASGIGGLVRDLSAGEMLSQVYEIQKDKNTRVSGIVIMGGGEPLHNLQNVLKFIRMLNSKEGMGLGMRHITISTCGLVPEIYQLADYRLQVTLAVSLHAPFDELRRKLMPAAGRYTIEELLTACRAYAKATGRRVTYEYALINGMNDTDQHARALGGLLKGSLCHVNLIPVNTVKEQSFTGSRGETAIRFVELLAEVGVTATVRRKMGADIEAACGQLRRDRIME